MKTSPWPSASFQRLSRRERLVVLAGTALTLLTLVTVFGVLPLASHWAEREAAIAAKAEQRARLRALVADEARIGAALASLRDGRNARSGRLLTGATRALAASDLQLLLRRYADQSRVVIDRVDVVSESATAQAGLAPVPVRVSGSGDVSGLVDLLFYLQHGEKLLVIDEVRVTGSTPRNDGMQLLTWSLRLHGYYGAVSS